MDQIVKIVQEKTGLDEQTARKATNVVLNVLQDRLPEPVAGQLRKLTGDHPDAPDSGAKLDDVAGQIGGMLGK